MKHSLLAVKKGSSWLLGVVAAALALIASPALSLAGDQAAALARMPAPWREKPRRFTAEEYDATVRYWAEKHPGLLALSERGRSADGYPLWLLDLTDKSAPDDDKQRVLITGLYAGPERTGTASILRLVEWLLGGEAEARTILQKQRVLVMPILNPHGFFPTESNANAAGLPVYDGRRGKMWDIPAMTLREPEKTPELRAFLSVVDEFQPEVHADVHGVALHFNGELVAESVGSAGSNFALRPWDARVNEAMIAAAREAGYASDRWEADAQRMFWGPELEPHAAKLWMGRVFFYPGTYPYMRYHTMPMLTENGWDEGGAARLRGLLRVGNAASSQQAHPGYAVDRVAGVGGHYLAAYGRHAAARRASRVELWERQGSMTLALLHPQCDARALVACALTPAGRAAITSRDPKMPMLTTAAFLENMKTRPEMDAEALAAFVRAGPDGKLYYDPAPQPPRAGGLDHGLTFILRLPDTQPELLDVRLNGHALTASESDGYHTWLGDGFTHLQFHIPPGKTRAADLFIASVAYKPGTQRPYGWRPPAEVLERLKK